MSLSDLASFGSFVSGVAVLASLVFLFFQMRQMTEQVKQSERNQQALIRQGVRTRGTEINLARSDPSVADAVAKGTAGAEDITATQYQQFASYELAYFIHVEDAFFQHREGLLTDSAFSTVRLGFKNILSRPGVRQYMELVTFPEEFMTFVSDLKAETPVNVRTDQFDQWKAGVAVMKANAAHH